jgi:NAD(P)-dependent dehydrogenase (short-subunit alcohol dehydrogenase family)
MSTDETTDLNLPGAAPGVAELAGAFAGDLRLDAKVAVVSGAGSLAAGYGNGRAAAILLARFGARVACVDRDAEAAASTVAAIADAGGTAASFVGDVGDAADCERIIAAVEAELGPPAILVNNVGVAGPPGTVADVDLEAWERTVRVNVDSVLLMSRFCVPAMAAAGEGAIVNVSSVAGLLGGHPAIAYSTTKGAVAHMTRAMAAQHGGQGIRVNCVAPGMVYTPMVVSRGLSDETRAARVAGSSLKFEGTAWDVAAAILFLAGPMSRWITGVVMPVDGGYSSAMPLPTAPRHVEDV